MRQFDTIKKDFDPFEEECEQEYEIPIRGAPEIPEIGLEEGHLKLSKYVTSKCCADFRDDIQSVFDPVFGQILSLIQDQINSVRTKHKEKMQVLETYERTDWRRFSLWEV